MSTENTPTAPAFNAALHAQQMHQAGDAGQKINGGRIFGIFGDSPGLAPNLNTQGWGAKQIMQGGIAGLGSSHQKAPGILKQIGLDFGSIRDSLLAEIKKDPGIQQIAQMNTGGIQSMPAGTPVSSNAPQASGSGAEIA